jgi:hypothetical protein
VNFDTFIEVAEDCPAACGEVPPARSGRATKAAMEYNLIAGAPYSLTEEDVAFSDARGDARHPGGGLALRAERFLSQEKPVFESVCWPSATAGESTSTRTGAWRWWGSSRRSMSVSLSTQRFVTFERSDPSARNRRRRRVDWARSLRRTRGGSLRSTSQRSDDDSRRASRLLPLVPRRRGDLSVRP